MLSQTVKFFNSQIGDVGQKKSHLYTHVDNALVEKRKGGNKQGKTKRNRNLNQHVNDLEMPII